VRISGLHNIPVQRTGLGHPQYGIRDSVATTKPQDPGSKIYSVQIVNGYDRVGKGFQEGFTTYRVVSLGLASQKRGLCFPRILHPDPGPIVTCCRSRSHYAQTAVQSFLAW
jgi:hypothetical protein